MSRNTYLFSLKSLFQASNVVREEFPSRDLTTFDGWLDNCSEFSLTREKQIYSAALWLFVTQWDFIRLHLQSLFLMKSVVEILIRMMICKTKSVVSISKSGIF